MPQPPPAASQNATATVHGMTLTSLVAPGISLDDEVASGDGSDGPWYDDGKSFHGLPDSMNPWAFFGRVGDQISSGVGQIANIGKDIENIRARRALETTRQASDINANVRDYQNINKQALGVLGQQAKALGDVATGTYELVDGIMSVIGLGGALKGITQFSIKGILRAFAGSADNFADDVARMLKTKCFARDTLVSTESGLRPIGEIKAGEQVHAFDFQAGEWKLRKVVERIDSIYEGAVVTIETGDSKIEATIHHPFWVVKGHELAARSTPRKFSDTENQGQTLPGRWVNSHEIQAGDVIIGRDGKTHTVTGVSQRFESEFKVSNLTIGELHNYSVGVHSILVHNDAICEGGVAWLKSLLDSGEASYDDIARFVRGFDNADEVLKRLGSRSGIGGATGLRPGEIATGYRLEAQLGRSLKESAHPGADYVDSLGRSYDAIGGFNPKYWNEKSFLRQIDRHLLKSNDFTVIDLTGFSQAQIDAVRRHLATLSPDQLKRIIRIGF